jgi:hypothetical protein
MVLPRIPDRNKLKKNVEINTYTPPFVHKSIIAVGIKKDETIRKNILLKAKLLPKYMNITPKAVNIPPYDINLLLSFTCIL